MYSGQQQVGALMRKGKEWCNTYFYYFLSACVFLLVFFLYVLLIYICIYLEATVLLYNLQIRYKQ